MTDPELTFAQAVEFLEQGIDYEKKTSWKYDLKTLDLGRTEDLVAELGNPQERYGIVHVAGTKGKGSTAAAIAHCLVRLGHRTGLYIKPHLITPRERVRMDGRLIDEAAFTRIVAAMKPYVERLRALQTPDYEPAPTYFEMLTALALAHFAERDAEWAVVEVGLGGRLDSTNIVTPRCCVITAIGFDHMDKLGETPDAIAAEKAGILKDGVPVVIGRQQYPEALTTLRRMADERGCPRWEVGADVTGSDAAAVSAPADERVGDLGWTFTLHTPSRRYDRLFTPLLGAHQLDNLAAGVGALEMAERHAGLNIDPQRVREAIAEFRIAGRVEVLQSDPLIVLDVAHTVESVRALLDALALHLPGRRLHVVFGCSAEKDLAGMLALLGPRCASSTATQASLPRAVPAQEVADAARRWLEPEITTDPWAATEGALSRAGRGDIVCVTGSFLVAGAVRAGWLAAQGLDPDQSAV